MEMSTVLQVALFFASLAIILLVACIVPIAFQVRRRLEQLALTADSLKASGELLVRDSRELVLNVNDLAVRANQQLDDAAEVVHTVRQWTQRTDRLLNEVGSVVEPPVFTIVRKINLLRAGASTLFKVLFHSKQETEHV